MSEMWGTTEPDFALGLALTLIYVYMYSITTVTAIKCLRTQGRATKHTYTMWYFLSEQYENAYEILILPNRSPESQSGKTLFAIQKVEALSFDHITPHDSHQKEIFALYVMVFYYSNWVKGSSYPVISIRKYDSGVAHFRKALKVELKP